MKADINRDEYIIVEYESYIKNISEALVLSIAINREKYGSRYPKYKEYEEYIPDSLFENTINMMPISFLISISNGKLSRDDIEKDYIELLKSDVVSAQKNTNFELALYGIALRKFCKKIYIIKRTEFQEFEIARIKEKFNDVIDKISLCSGTVEDLLHDHAEITMIFMNSAKDLENILNTFDKAKIRETSFVLKDNIENIYYNKADNIRRVYSPDLYKKCITYGAMLGRINIESLPDIKQTSTDNFVG